MTNTTNRQNATLFCRDRAEKLLPDFHPEQLTSLTALQWIRRVEGVATAYDWDDNMLLTQIIGKLKGAALLWWDSNVEDITTWPEFRDRLLHGFPSSVDQADIHLQLSKRRKERNESYEAYVYSMKSIAKKGDIDEASIIKYILNGMYDRELTKVMSLCDFTDVEELLKKIKRYENIEERSKGTNWTTQRREHPTSAREGQQTNPNQEVRLCHNCNTRGHLAKDCRRPVQGKRCFICKNDTHLARTCPKATNRLPNHPETSSKTVRKIKTVQTDQNDEYHKQVKIDGHEILAFIDLGSDCVTLRERDAKERGIKYVKHAIKLKGFGGGESVTIGRRSIVIEVESIEKETEVFIVPDDAQDIGLIIGRSLLDDADIMIIRRNGELHILENTVDAKLTLEKTNNSEKQETPEVHEVKRITLQPFQPNEIPLETDIPEEIKEELIEVVNEYRDCFANNLKELGTTNISEFKIELTSDEVVTSQPYRVPYGQREKAKALVKDLLEADVIQESRSPYSSPMLLVQKKTGDERLCVDYRRINKLTKKDKFPTPLLDEQIDQLAGNKYFTTVDLASGYYQIPMEKESQHLTAFVTSEGKYEFKRMPFGLVNAPSEFQRTMSKLFEHLERGTVLIYMDDLLIPSRTEKDGVRKLKIVLDLLREANLTLKLPKCKFLSTTATYLGFEITKDGIRPGKKKTDAVTNFKRPGNPHEIRQFIGLASFFRRFIPSFSIMSKPLTMLTRQDVVFKWEEEQEQSFRKIKECLTTRPVLALFDVTKKHELHTDASQAGIAGILLQNDEESHTLKPVSYFSRQTRTEESKWHSYELEMLAITESVEKFRVYLLNRQFKIVTDCEAIKSTMSKKNISPRIARWMLKLQEYDYETEHRAGERMKHVDALSRQPAEPPEEPEICSLKVRQIKLDETDWLHTVQMQDPYLVKIKETLTQNQVKNAEEKQIKTDYEMKNHCVYRRTPNGTKWVVPSSVRWRIVRQSHDDAGHYAIEKTMQDIQKYYWFPRMKRFVKNYIASCIPCAYYKQPAGKKEGEMHPIPRKPIPFETVHCDHLGPFPKTARGNTHIFVYIDGFTKYIIIRATKNTKTTPVCNILNDIFQTFGPPRNMITDRGTAFTAAQFTTLCTENVISHIKNATATPRANGQVERYNRTITAAVTTMSQDEEGTDWDQHLRVVQWSLNNLPNKTTKRSPHELLFNYKPRNALQNKITLSLQNDDDEEDIPLSEIRKRAQEAIKRNQAEQKRRFDSKRRPPNVYFEGDLVLIERGPAATGQSKKMNPKYKGPYSVAKVLPNDRYVLRDVPGYQLSQRPFEGVYASDKMKRWCQLPIEEDATDDYEDDSTEDDAEGRMAEL